MLAFPCPGCSEEIRVPPDFAGKTFPCPRCQATLSLPNGGAASEATLPPRANDATDGPTAPAVPGYEIVGELGRGGMGVVYQARQIKLGRVVALKMILTGGHASESDLARFRAEAEAVARLQHPNIVQVFEVGEAGGLPFFSLEFVEGGSLDRALAGTPLPARDAAALTEVLARAMHCAHERGVVHRDLKPANVLLSFSRELLASAPGDALARSSRLNDAVPKITDFGLAKRLGEQGQTQTGSIVGTPAYMAPEQAEGKKAIGPPADVYALGAILYECLTGRPPFRAATPLDTILQVIADDPAPPRRLNARVPLDLEIITLKSLEKAPERRYASALALADDLRHFLAGEPILARPAPWHERAVKWARRRPAVAALLAVSACAALAVAAVGLAYQARLRRSNADLAAALQQAEQEHDRAQGRLLKALEAVDRMLEQVSDERLAQAPQLAGLRRQMFEEALDFYRGFLRQESDEPAVRRETARAYLRIAALQFSLGRTAEAERACASAAALQEKLVAELPDEPAHQHGLAQSHAYLGHVCVTTGRFEEAARAYTKALTLDERLVELFPANADYAESLASDHNSLGFFNSFTNPRAAEAHFRRSVTLAEGLTKARPGEARYLCLLASCLTNFGTQQLNWGRPSEARETLERARDVLHPEGQAPPRAGKDYAPVSAKNVVWRGILYARARQEKQAEAALREGITAYEQMLQGAGDHFNPRHELTRAYEALAELYERAGRMGEAEEVWLKGVASAERMTRDYPTFTWVAAVSDRFTLRLLVRQARRGAIREVIPKARALAEKATLPGDVCYNLACVYAMLSAGGADGAAEEHARAAVALLRRAASAGFLRNPAAVEHAKKDEDLKSLRDRDDFRAVLAEAAKASQPATGGKGKP